MSSAITFSGFNDIDFNVILNAVMQQESQPLQSLQTRQSSLQSKITSFGTLATRAGAFQRAAAALSSASDSSTYSASSSDSTAVGISTSSGAVAGRYEVVVSELARAQVTASQTTVPDADTTAVATGGSLTIGGAVINVSSSMTLKQLAEAINASTTSPARAAVVQSGTNAFKLVLTGSSTGDTSSFTITNGLTGGAGIGFIDTNNDGVSGDSLADNAVPATNAAVTINNVAISSASNTLEAAIPGATLTLFKKSTTPVVIDVKSDPGALKTKLQTLVNTYNDFVKFANDQNTSAIAGNGASIGREPLLRQMRRNLRAAVIGEYDTGGAHKYLSQIGIELTESGTMQLNDSVYNAAVKNGTTDVGKLLAGTTGTPGALKAIDTMLNEYTKSQGILSSAQQQLTSQVSRLGTQIGRMQDQLAVRRTALQMEFTAADAAMTRLKSQSGSLSSLQF